MNSLTSRNAALLLILYLLWFVFSGIYKNHTQQTLAREEQEFRQQEIARDSHAKRAPITSASTTAVASNNQRRLTAEEIQKICMTRQLPNWVKGSKNKRLSIDEVEEIVSSGKLPKQ